MIRHTQVTSKSVGLNLPIFHPDFVWGRWIALVVLSLFVSLTAPETIFADQFAEYDAPPVEYTPQVPAYNPSDLGIEGENYESLLKYGFQIGDTYFYEFFQLYEDNRYYDLRSFITTDSILHNYHLYFDYLLKKVEEDKLASILMELNKGMLESSLEQYNVLKDTNWGNASRRNVAFFAVAGKLLDNNFEIPSIVKTEVEKELKLIDAHEGIAISPVINMGSNRDILEMMKEDYTQYIPRGHYTRSELLGDYFRTMMWYGRITFTLDDEDEVKSAVLMCYALDGEIFDQWESIFEPVSFFVGLSDDITSYQMKDTIRAAYGDKFNWKYLPGESNRFFKLIELLKDLDPPQINSIPVFNEEIQPDRENAIKGFRFMGQRFTLDASIFQRLIDREVPGRMLPSGLDIPAAMGSDEALNILTKLGHTEYPKYSENMAKIREFVSGLDEDTWTQNLYWCWLYTLDALIQERGEGYPVFMLNQAWTRKELNTFMGSFAELKHDTILYAKQAYAECGGPDDWPEMDDRGYVEPNPELYSRLFGLIRMTRTGLDSRGLISDDNQKNLELLEELVLSLKLISEKELSNQPLTDEEYELIRTYGGQLEHFWLEANREFIEESGIDTYDYIQNNPPAIIADVATDPSGYVLEIGTGGLCQIAVIVPIDGKPRIATGAVYTYYEFPWQMADRLTDETWRKMLFWHEPEHNLKPFFFELADNILKMYDSISDGEVTKINDDQK